MTRFYRYAEEAPDTVGLYHVCIEYRTAAMNSAAWVRWVHGADDSAHAVALAKRHVETFRRFYKHTSGSAVAYQERRP